MSFTLVSCKPRYFALPVCIIHSYLLYVTSEGLDEPKGELCSNLGSQVIKTQLDGTKIPALAAYIFDQESVKQ